MFGVMRIVVWAGSGASVSEISKLVDMDAVFTIWVESFD
jgi:hypothetical protein